MIWCLAFKKKPFQFWQEIWIKVVVILLQLYHFYWYTIHLQILSLYYHQNRIFRYILEFRRLSCKKYFYVLLSLFCCNNRGENKILSCVRERQNTPAISIKVIFYLFPVITTKFAYCATFRGCPLIRYIKVILVLSCNYIWLLT